MYYVTLKSLLFYKKDVSILEYDTKDIDNLKFFRSDSFEVTAITNHAEEMVYVKGMTQLLGNLLRSLSEEFVRFLVTELGTVALVMKLKVELLVKLLRNSNRLLKSRFREV